MPAWSATLDDTKIRQLAIFVSEARANYTYTDFNVGEPPPLPAGKIASEAHAFASSRAATRIDRLPYAIAPLPDGTDPAPGWGSRASCGEKRAVRADPRHHGKRTTTAPPCQNEDGLRHGLLARRRARAGTQRQLDLSLVHGSLQRLQMWRAACRGGPCR